MIPLKKSYKAFAYRFYSPFTQQCRNKFMKDISTAEADSDWCWVSRDQKFQAKHEFEHFNYQN